MSLWHVSYMHKNEVCALNVLDVVLVMVSGLACGLFFLQIDSLIEYIRKMDEDTACEQCSQKKDCLAWKKIGSSNWVTEFTFLSFLSTNRKCEDRSKPKHTWMVIAIVLNAIGYIGLYCRYGWCTSLVLMALCTTALIYIGMVDWHTQYIPVEFNIFILILGLIRLILWPEHWLEQLIGLCSVSAVLFVVDWAGGKLLHRDHVIGGGDIKLMAAAGLFLGWKLNIVAFVIGCVCGSVVHPIIMKIGKGERQLAFGPYLAMGIYIAMICGEQLMSWYLGIMGL